MFFLISPTNSPIMDPKILQFSPRISPAVVNSPLFISYKTTQLKRCKLYSNPLSVSANLSEKSQFLGQDLVLTDGGFGYLGKLGNTRVGISPVRAVVKRRKEVPFDNVIQRDKKLKLVLKIRKILVSQPDRVMQLRELGRFRKELGLQKKRRFIALLKKFPAVFEIEEEGIYSLKFKLTPEAERLYFEEMKVRNEMEDLLVVKLRKLLMMSLDKRILIEKISHLKTDLALPSEFRDTICQRYPQYFRIVPTGRGAALELTHWDPELAVSFAELEEEENREREREERDLIIDRPLKFNKVKLPRGLKLSKGEMRRITQFREMPYISPYSDFSALRQGSAEKEKHACAVVHEILSLTVEKRTLVDHLTHFREEFRFSQQLRGMLIRHPDMFYVSLKGDRDSVFLREAYRDSHLVDKDRLLLIKEKLRMLVDVPRYPRRGARTVPNGAGGSTEVEDVSDDEDREDWSDYDDIVNDELGDDAGGKDDDWPNEDDDTPPDFDDDDDVIDNVPHSKRTEHLERLVKKDKDLDGEIVKVPSSKRTKQVEDSVQNDKNLVPMFPDGRPRERW